MAKFKVIEKLLKDKKIDYKIIDLPSVAISVDDVVRLSDGQIKEEEIVKTLVVKTRKGESIACILKGRDKLKVEVMERLATKEEILEIAQVEPGAVCPILIGIPIIIDHKVTKLKRINMGSGDHLKGLEMDFLDLVRVLSDYQIKEIAA